MATVALLDSRPLNFDSDVAALVSALHFSFSALAEVRKVCWVWFYCFPVLYRYGKCFGYFLLFGRNFVGVELDLYWDSCWEVAAAAAAALVDVQEDVAEGVAGMRVALEDSIVTVHQYALVDCAYWERLGEIVVASLAEFAYCDAVVQRRLVVNSTTFEAAHRGRLYSASHPNLCSVSEIKGLG